MGNKRKLTIMLLAAMLAVGISGCGSSNKDAVSIDMDAMKTSMMAADENLPKMVEVSSEDKDAQLNFTALSDLEYDRVDSYFYTYAKEGTAEEIAVVKLKDEADAATMMDSLHNHVEQRIGTLQEYSPDQVELADKAVITHEGAYVALIICKQNGMVQKDFQSYFK